MKTGQTIYLKPIGNRRGGNIITVVISKVGRKYFEVEPRWYGRFHIDTMYQDGGEYISNYKAYLSMEDIDLEEELGRLVSQIKTYFDRRNDLNIDQAREIVKILGI